MAIYCSPSQRARDTASYFLSSSSQPPQVLPDLREIHCGRVDGWPISEIQRCYPELWLENLRQHNPHFRWPGGESYNEFRSRTWSVLRGIVERHPGDRVLVVTHCGVISQVFGACHGFNPARWEAFRPGNASISELAWGVNGARPLAFDVRDHFGQKLRRPNQPPGTSLPPMEVLSRAGLQL